MASNPLFSPSFKMTHAHVDPTLDNALALTGVRSTTHIGPQGHHVTAYALFENYIRSLEDLPETIDRINSIVRVIGTMPNIYQAARKKFLGHLETDEGAHFNAVDAETRRIIEELDLRIMRFKREDERINDHIAEADKGTPSAFKLQSKMLAMDLNTKNFALLHTYLINAYLHIRNIQRYVSFPPVLDKNNQPSKGEGATVKVANTVLHVQNKQLLLSKNIDKKTLGETVELVTGHIKDLFYYPLVDDAEEQRDGTPKSYNKKSTFRNNDPQRLYFVTAIHLHTVFYTYPGLRKIQTEVVKSFVEKVAYDWKLTSANRDKFLSEITSSLEEFYKKEAAHADVLKTPKKSGPPPTTPAAAHATAAASAIATVNTAANASAAAPAGAPPNSLVIPSRRSEGRVNHSALTAASLMAAGPPQPQPKNPPAAVPSAAAADPAPAGAPSNSLATPSRGSERRVNHAALTAASLMAAGPPQPQPKNPPPAVPSAAAADAAPAGAPSNSLATPSRRSERRVNHAALTAASLMAASPPQLQPHPAPNASSALGNQFRAATHALGKFAQANAPSANISAVKAPPDPPAITFEKTHRTKKQEMGAIDIEADLKKLAEERFQKYGKADINDLSFTDLKSYHKIITTRRDQLGFNPQGQNKVLSKALDTTLTKLSIEIHERKKNRSPK